ncbi:hypothetical protein EB796_009686 [Bugula neritina]|uniref:Uncharacterized protein n=1 Tax=Bugula neritina TaxID=10212 RepID=A0A7J7K1H1_BUGNE|nr:hypothetical protein EB796_009686 [Bugula neritina]
MLKHSIEDRRPDGEDGLVNFELSRSDGRVTSEQLELSRRLANSSLSLEGGTLTERLLDWTVPICLPCPPQP